MSSAYRSLTLAALATSVLTVVGYSPAYADPLPGEIIKFQQLPLTGGVPVLNPYPGPFLLTNGLPIVGSAAFPSPTAPFPGHDELSTAFATAHDANNQPIAWQGTFMADDFADHFDSPVVHLRWWGSYLQNQQFNGVKQFLISFETDVPGVAGAASHPGTPLLNQIVNLGPLAPSSGTFTEAIVPGAAPNPTDGPLYQYNAELHLGKEFAQKADTVYWLKIVALVDPTRDGQISWGWHDRDWMVPDIEASVPPGVSPGEGVIGSVPLGVGTTPVWHFQDDAVTGGVTISPGLSPIMPDVTQTGFPTTHYVDGIDGPTGISQFSKDLAFELYTTVPEPTSMILLTLGAATLTLRRRR